MSREELNFHVNGRDVDGQCVSVNVKRRDERGRCLVRECVCLAREEKREDGRGLSVDRLGSSV